MMRDPRRLLDDPESAEARLLSSAFDEPPPRDLLARTLEAAGAAATGTALAASGGAAKAGAAAAAKAAGSGILGAVGVGALAGLITVGAVELATNRVEPPVVRAVASAPAAPARALATPAASVAQTASATPSQEAHPPYVATAPLGPPPSTLAAELSLLDEARAALREGQPARARAVLDRYEREIPRGQMAREAALLRAEVDAAREEKRVAP
jgi:hypothetical protein